MSTEYPSKSSENTKPPYTALTTQVDMFIQTF